MDFIGDGVKTVTKAVSSKNNIMKTRKRCSHLYYQDKDLEEIPKLYVMKDTVVLYLYNNEIVNIENLDGFPNLTSLYLQNNKIEKLENLKNLTKLKKLYIGHNRINVLEGLENMRSLQELHVEKQDLADNNPFCVDPRTIFCISETLQILNISHNCMTSLKHLSPLKNLQVINAAFNDLDDIKDTCETIRNWCYLKEATFAGNSFTKQHRYREDIIANSYCLENLDGKSVSGITRTFIRRFQEEKLMHGSRQSINIADVCQNLPRNYPPTLQKAVSASILKKSEHRLSDDLATFDEKNGVYIAWKTLPTRKPPHRLQNKPMKSGKKRVVINSFPQISNI